MKIIKNSRQVNASIGVWKHYLDFMELLMNQFDNPDGPLPKVWSRIPIDSNKKTYQTFLDYRNGKINIKLETINPDTEEGKRDGFIHVESNVGGCFSDSLGFIFEEALKSCVSTMIKYRFKGRIKEDSIKDKVSKVIKDSCTHVSDALQIIESDWSPCYLSLPSLESYGKKVLNIVSDIRNDFETSVIKICERYLRDNPEPNMI